MVAAARLTRLDGEGASEQPEGFLRYCVVRVAGLPIEHLVRLNAPRATAAADGLLDDRIALRADARTLTDQLHDVIPEHARSRRRKLLRLRRDIHNLRCPKSQDLAVCAAPELRLRLEEFAASLTRWMERREAFEAIYADDLATAHRFLRESLGEPDFRAGVRLSSSALAAHLTKATVDDPEPLDTKAQNALLRYLTRTAAKATPFARFCTILPGVLEPAGEPLTLDADPSRKWSRIRSNKRLMQAILRHLLGDPEARAQLPVRLNPTLSTDAESLRFMSSFDAAEAFQSVARNPALDVVLGELQHRGAGTVRSLATAVMALPELEAPSEEVEQYVDRLFDIGLLQLDLPGLGNDPEWTRRLRELTASMDGSRAVEATALLDAVMARVAAIRERGVAFDEADLTTLEDGITGTLKAWGGGHLALRGPPVYEDASARGWARIDDRHFAAALNDLRDLVEMLIPLGWDRAQHAALLRFFRAHFGSNRVPLLEFYEAHARDQVEKARQAQEGAHEAATSKAEGKPSSEHSKEDPFQRASRTLSDLVARRWWADPDASEIALHRGDFEPALDGLPALPEGPLSMSVFVNWVPRPGRRVGGQILVPRGLSTLGFGKFFSRFLYLFPDEVLEALGKISAPTDTVLAEIAGDQSFNANLRPPIHGAEIIYPNGDRAGCAEAFEVGRLEVGPNERNDRLDLYEKGTQRRILPLDLGFMSPRLRPPLYQLLRSFSPAASSYVPLPTRPLPTENSTGPDPAGRVMHQPRITYEKHVILARETWSVAVGRLPVQEADEGDAAFFLRVRDWQSQVGLPDVVYLKAIRVGRPDAPSAATDDASQEESDQDAPQEVASEPVDEVPTTEHADPAEEADEPTDKVAKTPTWHGDFHKPQYLDFRAPVLVGLLGRYRSLQKDFLLVFEECLPSMVDLPATASDQHWVTESIIQLNLGSGFREAEATPPENRVERDVVHV